MTEVSHQTGGIGLVALGAIFVVGLFVYCLIGGIVDKVNGEDK
jgi:hypothetical protein